MKLGHLLLSASLLLITRASSFPELVQRERQAILSTTAQDSSSKAFPLLDFHRQLCQIESTSGNEKEAGGFLVSYLNSLGLTVDVQHVHNDDYSGERFNVYAYLGKSRKTKVLLSSHFDTVPPYIPYSLKKNGTEIWGRGVVDAKGSVAAQVAAFQTLRQSKKDVIKEGSVGMLFVVGEETFGDGMQTVNKLNLTWDSVIFGEPTEGKLATGHKGILGIKLVAIGVATHSGYPWLGVDANRMLIKALNALDKLADEGGLPQSKKYGNTTVNIGQMSGGVASNVVPEHAEASLAFRLAGDKPSEIVALVQKTLENAMGDVVVVNGTSTGSNKNGTLEVHVTAAGYPPINIDHDIPGFETVTVNYGTDVPNLHGDHKKYLYGPGSILVAHSKNEHLTVKQLEQAAEDYQKLILATLGV